MALQTIVTRNAIPATLGSSCPRACQVSLIVAVAALVAAGAVVGDHARDAADPRPAEGAAGASRRSADDRSRRPRTTQIRAAYRRLAERDSVDTMERLGREYPARPGRAALPRDRARLGGLPERGRGRAPARQEGRPATRPGRSRPTACSTRSSSVELPGLPAARRRTRCSSRARACSSRAASTRPCASTSARRGRSGERRGAVAAAVARFDKDNLNASFSRLGPAHAQVPDAASRSASTSACCSRGPAQRDPAIAQFEKAVALGPNTELGRGAAQFLRERARRWWDRLVDQMSRSAYGVRPMLMRQFRRAREAGAATGGGRRG